ncbi:MAG: hypothetical protein LBM77_02930, partial [Spirochaetaceae bacterium]|nr:hypothetical protein [Spirochaetaceae bacterium]
MADRITELETLIKRYQDSYYKGSAEITDTEFDALWDELKRLDPGNAILQKVGSDLSDGFPKARHIMPMGSQQKAANYSELLFWAEKNGNKFAEKVHQEWVNWRDAKKIPPSKLKYEDTNDDVIKELITLVHSTEDVVSQDNMSLFGSNNNYTYLIQYKLDGTSLELQYKDGLLEKAITRGNGVIGDDITNNAKKIKGVLYKLQEKWTGAVRGEILMLLDVWRNKYSNMSNWRNSANGIVKGKNGEGCDDLNIIVYDALCLNEPAFFKNETDKITWLKKQNFDVVFMTSLNNIEDVYNYRNKIEAKRSGLPFGIDGLVIKSPDVDIKDMQRVRPDKQIAFKFKANDDIKETVLREVIWSENGTTYTPVGVFDAVEFPDAIVKQASLNNPEQIKKLGLRIGSRVRVVKRGDIIPKIEGLTDTQPPLNETQPIIIPEYCNVCGSKLEIRQSVYKTLMRGIENISDTLLYCPNPNCPKRLEHRLKTWVRVLKIRELGEKLIEALFKSGLVKHISDFYCLTEKDLTPFFLTKESIQKGEVSKGAAKVIRNLLQRRDISLATFVAGFDIDNIGEQVVQFFIDAGFDTIEKLQDVKIEDFGEYKNGYHWEIIDKRKTKVNDAKFIGKHLNISEKTAKALISGISEVKDEMDAVLNKGI